MPTPTAVLNIVGLTRDLIGEHTPHIARLAREGEVRSLVPDLPAVTSTVQSSMVTGVTPREHGIVANGWFERDLAEVRFWKQSNRIVTAEKVWETARKRDPSVTTANMFWWFNMYSTAEWSVTPRPIYKADGRKIPDCYSAPGELRDMLQAELGTFPLFRFWGPASSIESSRWIARASRLVHERHEPTLTLVYLPHLDYALQQVGPDHPRIAEECAGVDAEVGALAAYFENAGVRVVLVSEYGIESVSDAVHVNRVLREAGAITVREEEGLELLDPGASAAFAVADHQVAHVYVADPSEVDRYAALLSGVNGVAEVYAGDARADVALDNPRSGDIVLVAARDRWFSYDYWLDDARAPDFARTVDIHRKPGYDPVELFLDPAIRFPKLAIGRRLAKKILGFRQLMDVIPLDTSLVRGSHGRTDGTPPVLITPKGVVESDEDTLHCTAVRDVVLSALGV